MTAIAHPSPAQRQAINRVGLWLFIASEAFLFFILLAARFLLAGTSTPAGVSQVLGLALTVILLSSSLTAYLAERSISRGKRSAFLRYLGITVVLGLAFLVMVGIEWAGGMTHFPPSTPYGSVFFTLTGTHALHLLSGLVVLGALYQNGRRERFTPEAHWGVTGGVLYWHFVDVVWLSVFTTLYLIG